MMTMAGLEGIVATRSGVSSISDGVLTYRGINIEELARHASFEEILYLLWNDELPTFEQLAILRRISLLKVFYPMKSFPYYTLTHHTHTQ